MKIESDNIENIQSLKQQKNKLMNLLTESELIKFYNKQMSTSINEITIEMDNLFFDPSL